MGAFRALSSEPFPSVGGPPEPSSSLAEWLEWQRILHPKTIVLGLGRVASVWGRLGPARWPCPVITVGGTNGKGSCVAFIEAVFRMGGYRVCAYTSPHLLRYNERIRIDGREVDDATLCAAFARVEGARGDCLLTYFEFGTLAALDLFVRAAPDLVILEVGLGGRLDAVNVIDADVAVVTTIGHDHTAWLGEDLSSIAREKAGIFRQGCAAVIGQRDAPPALRAEAEARGCDVLQLGREFHWEAAEQAETWRWWGPRDRRLELPTPSMRGPFQYDNAAAALAAADSLRERLPLPVAALRQGLQRVKLAARFQVLPGRPCWILDVAHNAEAAAALAESLARWPCAGRRHAVMAVLEDKQPEAIFAPLAPLIDVWHLTQTEDPRAMPTARLQGALAEHASDKVLRPYQAVAEALEGAANRAGPDDTIVVLGSFTTAEAALRHLQAQGVI